MQLQDEPIADNVCIPLYFLAKLVKDSETTVVQVGEGADENFLGYWWCEHYRQKYENVYKPALAGPPPWWKRLRLIGAGARRPAPRPRTRRSRRAREPGQELFWGGAVCWWGERAGELTPNPGAFAQAVDCPVDGLLPEGFAGRSTATRSSRTTSAGSPGISPSRRCCRRSRTWR